jgi:hypothetical protein
MPKISLTAITGITQPQTLKLKGHIKKENVTILVDIGSTHNFIDVNVANNLNLIVYPSADIRVMVADGKKIDGVGKCHKIKLQVVNYELESGFYTVPLGGVDIVLGIQWLQMLGTCSTNHQKQFIKFKWEGIQYKLYRFQPPPTQIISSQQMEKLIRKGAPSYVAHCHQMELLTTKIVKSQDPEIQALIQKHDKVFQDLPMKMPPNRNIEHIIEVKPDSTLVNIRPYLYPYHHKTEIKRLIQDLLKCEVIMKSNSPYAPPIVLVQKKGWIF